ncbi:MAG: hypothetical protein IPG50_01655 [Myxococcales bacterium]|nr:hypothetical protein [Myxococcales bacterium]
MGPSTLGTTLLACAFAASACGGRATATVGSSTTTSASATAVDAHGSRKKELIGAPVLVDGKAVAGLSFGELPSDLLVRRLEPTGPARYFRLYEYLKTIGVDVDRVRAVHVRGNAWRIASIEGDELAREQDRLVFDFLGGTSGGAKVAWDTTGLRNTFRVDEIRQLLVYVDQPAPALDARKSCYLAPQAEGAPKACSDAVPYAEEAPPKGTRVYLDGKLVGHVKRRKLTSDLVVGERAGKSVFGLGRLLTSFGVDVAQVREVELLAGDALVGRGNDVATKNDGIAFVLPQRQSGRVLLDVPSTWQAPASSNTRSAEITAILVFRSKASTGRPLTDISDAPPSESSEPQASSQ